VSECSSYHTAQSPGTPRRRTESPSDARCATPIVGGGNDNVDDLSERLLRAEREYIMIADELAEYKQQSQRQLNVITSERDELRLKLHDALLVAERVGGQGGHLATNQLQIRKPEEYETAMQRMNEMQVVIDELTARLDAQTSEHQQIYLAMFRKGQQAAGHELDNRRVPPV
jgi:hypothetical protein